MKVNKHMFIAAITIGIIALAALALRGIMEDGQWKTTVTLSAIMLLVAESSYLFYRLGLNKIPANDAPKKTYIRKLNWRFVCWIVLILVDAGLYSIIGANVIGEYFVRVIFIGLLSLCVSNRKIKKAAKNMNK